LRSERRQPSGESDWFGISGPAANESPRPTQSAARAAGARARASRNPTTTATERMDDLLSR
jgi:hypothetical protein